jgi:hypothetical protein
VAGACRTVVLPLRRLVPVRHPHLAVLLALLLLLAGCRDASPQDLLDRAPEALDEAGTSRFEMQVTAVGQGVDSTFGATGEQDLGEGTLRMTTDLGLDATRTETLVFGDTIYLRSPLFELFTGDPDTWVRIGLEDAGRTAGLDIDTLVEGNTGPAALVQQLRGAADDIEELGSEQVRGVDTRHLRVVVDTDLAIEQSPPEVREQLRAFAATSGLPATYPMEVWVDEDALIRRVRTVVEVEDETAGPVTQETTLELFDFGLPVDVVAPDDAEVVDLRTLLDDLEALEEELDLDTPAP